MRGSMLFASRGGQYFASQCHYHRSSIMASFFGPSSLAGTLRWVPRRDLTHNFSGNTEEFMKEVNKFDVVVVRFGAKWCKPCIEMTPAFEELSEIFCPVSNSADNISTVKTETSHKTNDDRKEPTHLESAVNGSGSSDSPYTQVKHNTENSNTRRVSYRFLDIDISENESVSALHDVRCVPTFCCYVQKGLYGNIEGAHIDQVQTLVTKATEEIKNGSE
eukprot:Tbor_TRINITY_DN5017_c0_g1::TRINITY_DN5017_c0_g1_i1::g.14059::m.14059